MSNIEQQIEEALARHDEALQRSLLAFSNRIYTNILTLAQTVNEYGQNVASLTCTIPAQSRNSIVITSWIISFDPTNISSLTVQLGRFALKYSSAADLATGFKDTLGKSILLRPNDTRTVTITTTAGTPAFINALLMGFSVGEQGSLT